MKVEIISCLQDNYSYLIIDETNNLACVVDPSEARPIIDYLKNKNCLLYTSDAADEGLGVDLGGRRII